MIDLTAASQRLQAVRTTLLQAGESLDVVRMRARLQEYQHEMAAPGFWDDVDKANKTNQQSVRLEQTLQRYDRLISQGEDIETLLQMAKEEQDDSLDEEIVSELDALAQDTDALRLETLLTGEYDHNDAILSLHAGAGGTEAQDWVSMLYRMYQRYCDRKGFTVRELDFLEGDEAGIKSVTFEVKGDNAYGYLKAERGVHRLVRISPFDSSARRHTSFGSLDVMPVIENDGKIEIKTEDLKIDTYRAGGAGGQHVNRTDSAVRLTHLPSGIVVACQNERSQLQNKETAMRILLSRLAELREKENLERLQNIKGEQKKIEWGSQIRSYVFQPYTMVKDHRTDFEVGNVDSVMDGGLDGFVHAYLGMMAQ